MSTTGSAPRVRVVVLGATGCLGRQICATLAQQGHDVVAVARTFAPQVAEHRFLARDLGRMTGPEIGALLTEERAGAVVNASGTWERSAEELDYAHVTIPRLVTEGVAAAAGRPRLVHIGTIHEYGPVPPGTVIDERRDTRPETPYARAKLIGTRTVLEAAAAGRIDAVTLRVANVFGPFPSPKSFLGTLAARLRTTGPGETIELTLAPAHRDHVDTRDVADAVGRAVRCRADTSGQAVNIGRGEALDLRDLVYGMVAAAGLPPEAVKEGGTPLSSAGGGDWTSADVRRARTLLGWSPLHTVEESLKAMLDLGGW
ncbi:NAD-dependent epimerase/dehydratase family protein [Streptomyces sp. NBC_00328]|uniref:NAD-dependent epimerase/dehydratase family protein n=1 Tax=Streptomyces sp. NBC_00328 TaxID=2903646 RepID=UPI002E29FAA5|nr:NAD(P)-dependent oxidoreductase [Streptomyces sp. NBC_00328]